MWTHRVTIRPGVQRENHSSALANTQQDSLTGPCPPPPPPPDSIGRYCTHTQAIVVNLDPHGFALISVGWIRIRTSEGKIDPQKKDRINFMF